MYGKRKIISASHAMRSMVVFAVFLFFLNCVFLGGQTDLLEAYKSGPIRLEPDPEFGKDVDWNSLFYNLFCDLTVAPDGSIFVASSRQHKIYKFDGEGNLIQSFGQEGQGPGDFYLPGDLSILDKEFLVVGEYASLHRVSLFDLEGNFQKLLKTQRPPFWSTALRDGKIAYVVNNYRGEGRSNRKKIASVVIRDIDGDQEIKVAEATFTSASIIMGQGMVSFGDATSGRMFIASSKEGNLLVGNSLRPEIEVFTPEGTKLATVPLNIEPIPVTRQLINEYKNFQITQLSSDPEHSQAQKQEMLREMKKSTWEHMFAENLPLYRELLVDSEGNLIVFRRTDCLAECPIFIQVYSPSGQFVCETELVEGSFLLPIDPRIKNMGFTERGLIALVEVKDAPEFSLRLMRVLFR